MKMNLWMILIFLFLQLSHAAPGRDGVYRGKYYEGILNSTKVVDKKHMMVLGLTLWDSTLQDAQQKIGGAPIRETGVAPRDTAQVCYKGIDSLLLLISPNTKSSGENPQFIQSFIISIDKNIKERVAPCIESPKMGRDFTFLNGVRLGMSQAEVKKIWGKPSLMTPKVMIYDLRRIQKEYFSDDISIYLEFKNDKLAFVDASRLAIR